MSALPIDVVSVQSQVAYGRVGNSIAAPALDRRGLRVAQVPTVVLSNTPHYPTFHGQALAPAWMAGLLRGLDERGVPDRARAVLSGYLGNTALAGVLADWLGALHARRPELPVCIDPVLGDIDNGLYLEAALIDVYRERLLPLATVLTPNHFELEQLVGRPLPTLDAVVAGARELLARGPRWIAVTSAAPGMVPSATLRIAVVTPDRAEVVDHARVAVDVKGTGDLFSAEVCAAVLDGLAPADAVRRAAGHVVEALRATARRGWEELILPHEA